MYARTHIPTAFLMVVLGACHGEAQDGLDFNRDIRPILSNKCFRCHGPDEDTREAELRFDTRAGLFADLGGYAAVTPGSLKKSAMAERIRSDDPDAIMPPLEAKKPLSNEEIELLERWIREGAIWEQHWAFSKPKKTEPPKPHDPTWPANEIDGFLLARMRQHGLTPSPTAPPEVLVRRVYLDLTGLPPTPEQADHWASQLRGKDNRFASDAWESLVDELLASPEYGARWARRWLDLARYADTNGYEKDRDRSIWPYRDWVIQAINDDMPFDQFTVEQIAGDLLPNATREQRIATGFHRNTMLNEEGGIDPLEFRFHAMTDRVATTGVTWLGLTLQCAQCHTHKYDPVSHRDYYRLMALLNNADEPYLEIPTEAEEASYAARLLEAEQLLARLPEQWPGEPVENLIWLEASTIKAVGERSDPAKLLDDGSALFAAPGPAKDVYTITLASPAETVKQATHLRLDALTDESLPNKGPGRTDHGNFVLTELEVWAAPANAPDKRVRVALQQATASAAQKGFPASHAIDGDNATGWAVHADDQPLNTDKHVTFAIRPPKALGKMLWTIVIRQAHGSRHTLGRVRVRLGAQTPSTNGNSNAMEAAFARWLDANQTKARWVTLRADSLRSNLPHLENMPDNSIFASGDTAKHDTYFLGFQSPPDRITALRLEAMPDERLPARGPGSTYYEGTIGDFFLGELQVQVDGKPWNIASATHSYAKNRYGSNPVSAQLALDGDLQTGWSVHGRLGERHTAVFVLDPPVEAASQIDVRMDFGRHFASSLGRFRISVTGAASPPPARDYPADVESLLDAPEDSWTEKDRSALRNAFLLQAKEVAEHAKRIRELRKPPAFTTTLVFQERPEDNPRPTHIHHRGEYLSPKARVAPGTPEFLHALEKDGGTNRLAFARWLTSRENPLTARVVVNRNWAAFFGRGITPTLEDLGLQGQPPSHPQLLDWLAVDFMDHGWSRKHLHKKIVLSRAYRQSAVVSPKQLEKDPANRWWARAPRFRLEAEVIRDATLFAAGILSLEHGGPPVRPPQPAGVTEAAYGRPSWQASTGDNRFRRSVYTYLKRTAPFAMYSTFDAPTGESCTAKRNRSNTALQALTLLNDVMFVEVAESFGKELASRDEDDNARASFAFRRVLTRKPSVDEQRMLDAFISKQRARLATVNENEREQGVWTLLARALFSLDEAITRN